MSLARRPPPWAHALVAALLAWAAQAQRGPGTLPLTLDNQHYYFVAERAASGVPPHLSHFDSKHALSMLVTGAAIRAGRALGVGDVPASRAVSMLAVALAAALLWALTFELTGHLLAAWLAVLVLLAFDGFLFMGAMGSRPKVFLVPFAAGTGLAVARGRPFVAGLAGSGAFLCWQPALLVLAAAVPPFLLGPRGLRALAALGLGTALAVATYHLGFLAVGALPELVEQTYRFTGRYMAAEPRDVGSQVIPFLRLAAGPSRQALFMIAFAGVLAGCLAVALARPRALLSRTGRAPGLTFVVLAALATTAFTLYDYGTFVDGFLVLPFVAVLVGFGLDRALGRAAEAAGPARSRAARRVGGALLLAAAIALALPPAGRRPVGPTLADQQSLGAEIRAWRDAGHSIWAVGCTHLLAFAHTDNHVRYGFFFRGMGPYLRERAGDEGWRPLRDGRMPDVILVSRPFTGSVPEARRWLADEYREDTPGAFRRQGVRVWWRRDAGAGAKGESSATADATPQATARANSAWPRAVKWPSKRQCRSDQLPPSSASRVRIAGSGSITRIPGEPPR